MFKKIPGNTEFLINLEEEFIDSYGEPALLMGNDVLSVNIEIFGKERSMKRNFLSLLAWYELGHIVDLENNLGKIQFQPIDDKVLRVKCGYILSFSEPIKYNNAFTHIPCFPRYAINVHGDVLDTTTNKVVTDKMTDSDGHASIYIYNPDRGGNKWTRIHRLMALAWLPNSDYSTRPFVNHLDGIKSNFELKNLEWCSHSENVKHALDSGLTKTTIKMKSRDKISGEVVIYNSAAEMKNKLGMTGVSASSWGSKLPGYLYRGRYEIKKAADDTPWYYEEVKDVEHSKAIVTISVVDKKTGEMKRFNNTVSFYKAYKLRPITGRLDDAVIEFKERYTDLDINYKRNSVYGPYRVLNLETGEEFSHGSIIEAGLQIGRSRTELQYDLSRNLKFIYSKKWIVVPASSPDEFVIEDYREKPKAFSAVEITREVDGVVIVARSMKEASQATNIDYKTVVKRINTGSFFKGFKYRALD